MPFSDEIEHVLDFLDQAAGKGLRKRNDMGTLLQQAVALDAPEQMNLVIFEGRQLHNLYSTLRKSSAGGQGYDTVQREFSATAERLREAIAQLLVQASDEQVERFNTQYYAMTQGSLRNLVDLAHDLGVFKGVQNERKYTDNTEEEEE